jgi:acetyltransferase-like isoleucine patch superfamily enzyme
LRAALIALLGVWRWARFRAWAAAGKVRLGWSGIRLAVDAPWSAVLAGPTRLEVGRERPHLRGGSLTIRIGRNVRFGHGVEIEVERGGDSVLDIGDDVHVRGGVRFKMRGGRITIGPGTVVRDMALLKADGDLVIGSRCVVSYNVAIHCTEAVTVEDHVVLADRTSVVDSSHDVDGSDTPWFDQPAPSSPIVIGANTLTLANSVVVKGTRIGRNSVLAAGAVARGEYPERALLVGAPAEVARILEPPER